MSPVWIASIIARSTRVIKPLGQGGFGATFLANDQALPGELISPMYCEKC